MGAVAAAMRDRGYSVTGQDDNVYPPMSTFLEEKRIAITPGFRAEDIPGADLVVIGNAMTRGNPAVEAVLNRKLYYLSLPQKSSNSSSYAAATTGRYGHPWKDDRHLAAGLDFRKRRPRAESPYRRNSGLTSARVRASETRNTLSSRGTIQDTASFDKRSKFLHYLPELVIVNNIEFDHADIYRDLEEIKTSFRRLLNIVPTEGMVSLNADDPNCVDVAKQCPAPIVEVGFSENAGNQIVMHATGTEFPVSSYSTPPLKFP